MNRSIFIILIALLFSFGACKKKCKSIPENNLRVRIENNLDRDLHRVTIGTSMNKGINSFRQCFFDSVWEDLDAGETSDYKTTSGSHLGYNNLRIEWREPEGHIRPASGTSPQMDSLLLTLDAEEDIVINVFNGDEMEGLVLPDGDYTYRLMGLSASENVVIMEMVKD